MSSRGGCVHHQIQHQKIHFFAVIVETTLRDGELRIPKSFVSKHWHRISSNPVILRLPNGTEWKVNWVKRDGDVWFHNDGWRKFAEHLSLERFQFLVFGYEGNSQFHVLVLNRSALEIEYPLTVSIDEDQEIKVEMSDDKSVEYLNEVSPPLPHAHHGKRPRSSSPSSQTPKKVKTASRKEGEKCHKTSNAETKGQKSKKTMHEKNKSHAEPNFSAGSERAYERAQSFSRKSKRPNFIGRLTSTSTHRYYMGIKTHFKKSYIGDKEREATLRVNQEGRTWNLKIRFTSNKRQAILAYGWKKFLEDNNLKLGDVCVFELEEENRIEVSLKVVIFRAQEDSNTPQFLDQGGPSHRPSSSSLKSPETPKTESRLMSDNHFTACFKNYNPVNVATIPVDFARSHFKYKGQSATLIEGKRSWPVKVLYYRQTSFAAFSQGWPAFARDCELKTGDACCFELINEEKLVFEVSIIRHIK